MNLYPAIDILGGNAVRLVKGDFDDEEGLRRGPARPRAAFKDEGARYLHVVDLDGAKSGDAGQRRADAARSPASSALPVQYGGGLRSPLAVEPRSTRAPRA